MTSVEYLCRTSSLSVDDQYSSERRLTSLRRPIVIIARHKYTLPSSEWKYNVYACIFSKLLLLVATEPLFQPEFLTGIRVQRWYRLSAAAVICPKVILHRMQQTNHSISRPIVCKFLDATINRPIRPNNIKWQTHPVTRHTPYLLPHHLTESDQIWYASMWGACFNRVMQARQTFIFVLEAPWAQDPGLED